MGEEPEQVRVRPPWTLMWTANVSKYSTVVNVENIDALSCDLDCKCSHTLNFWTTFYLSGLFL